MDRGLWSRSAVELAAMIRAREVSCVEVTESVLGRIDAHNGRLNAIVSECAGEARQSARDKDRQVVEGAELGPLHGVPVTIKENIDVAGQATTNGLPAFADLIAPDHSPLVRNLLELPRRLRAERAGELRGDAHPLPFDCGACLAPERERLRIAPEVHSDLLEQRVRAPLDAHERFLVRELVPGDAAREVGGRRHRLRPSRLPLTAPEPSRVAHVRASCKRPPHAEEVIDTRGLCFTETVATECVLFRRA